MRVFAGPNGSGKSILKSYLPSELLGAYLNPDEIEADIRRTGGLDFRAYGIQTAKDEVLPFLARSEFLKAEGLEPLAQRLRFEEGRLVFPGVQINAYFASVIVDFLRTKLLEAKRTFTFETVMSHPGKVDLFARGTRRWVPHLPLLHRNR